METLQTVVLPGIESAGEEELYVRANELAFCDLAQPQVRFLEGGEITTDTFYGGLTIEAWKSTSPVRSLAFELEGEGDFSVAFGVQRLGQSVRWLAEQQARLVATRALQLSVPQWERLADGLLFVRLRAHRGGGVMRAARYRTVDAAPNAVRLGLVITHFNRKAQVQPAIERIRRQVLQRPDVRGQITLTVVDNSRNLELESGEGVRYIPNSNFGGSGGFARGLLALQRDGEATHALFMDDDASCEAESILRCFALLRFAASPRLAVAGALLDEAEPWRLLEKGARFDGRCRALHAGLDLRLADHLLWAERTRERPDYGGWWFFAFPVQAVERYPFPFFVRGDDVFFSLHNRFEIATLNGIACAAEPFQVKHGPMTAYLDARYHVLHALLQPSGQARLLRRLVRQLFLKPLLSYQYASARAFTLALRHLAQGPRFFRENLDLGEVRAQIGSWLPSEKLQPVRREGFALRNPPPRERRERREPALRRALRVLTLQGFLLPRALLRDRVLLHEKGFHGEPKHIFRFRRVLYEHWQSDLGYVAEHDRAAFFRELGALIGALSGLWRRRRGLRSAYAQAMPELASREFWTDIYGLREAEQTRASTSTVHRELRGQTGAAVQLPAFVQRSGSQRATVDATQQR